MEKCMRCGHEIILEGNFMLSEINGEELNEEDDAMVTLWYDAAPGLMYSLSAAGNDLNGLDLTVLADQIYIPVQGNAG